MQLLSWLALLVAFSPALHELWRACAEDPYARPALLAPLLFAGFAWRERERRAEPRRDGLGLLVLAALLQGVGILGGSASIARIGLPVAVAGLARLLGRPRLQVAALVFWIVPVPTSLLSATTPAAETAWLGLAAGAMRTLGFALEHVGPVVRAGGERLELFAPDNGLVLAALLSELGWAAALWRGASTAGLLASALRWGLAACLIQPLAIGVALLLLVAVSGDAARVWLSHGLWPTTAGVGLLVAAGTARRLGRSSVEAPVPGA